MRSEFKSTTQIYVSPIYFEIQLILGNDSFFAYPFWIQICNLNLCKSHTFWNTANIEKWPFFAWWPKWWKKKNCPKFFHRVIFAFWIQICNPNLCKSHIFWNTANIENWPFFAYADLMTKIDEIGKIARNSFIG